MADENPIERLRPGEILADSAVTDYIKAMGLAIAEAQVALDMNSLAQVGEYVQPRPGLGGKSLLDLGLSPPFYHYQHADLSVSMQIVMKIGEQTAFGVNAKLDFGLEQGGKVSPANAREAQIRVTAVPASVTLDGTKTDATGTDVDAAAESLARVLRAPAGPFERAFVSSERKPVAASLEPGGAKNPILTPNAVAFINPAEVSVGIIRITQTPATNATEVFKLKAGKEASVTGAANRTLYARKVRDAIVALGGFKARLTNDPGGSSNAPDAPGALGIALFATDSDVLNAAARAELALVARMIRDGNLTVDVRGYADTRNTDDYNMRLGQRRADSVARFLEDNGVPRARMASVTTGGEARWAGAEIPADNQQFRRVEVTLAGSSDLYVLVESDGEHLQATPLPDMSGGGSGNGFIFAKKFSALAVDGTGLKLGASTVPIKGDAVNSGGTTHTAGSAEAHAFNLARDINAGTATHKVRASQQGNVVVLANADDAVVIDLVTLSANDIKLEAGGGATLSKPLAGIAAGPTASKDKPKVSLAVGVAVDYRQARQFEQSVNGNSAISARLVAVPAPVQFLEEIRKYLAPQPGAPSAPQG